MQRKPSPLLHDYKSSAAPKARQPRPLLWFALGLGLPLILSGMFFLLGGNSQTTASTLPAPSEGSLAAAEQNIPVTTDDPPMTTVLAVATTESNVDELRPPPGNATEAIEDAVYRDVSGRVTMPDAQGGFHPPLVVPEVVYDSLNIKVRRGDTLDQIFRRNKLDLGHLAQIANLPDAGKHLRLLRPGDEIQIQHQDGKLLSLQRDLALTSSLRVTRGAERFEAEIIERPIEKRLEMAYGRIQSSLFESGAQANLSDATIMNLAGIFAWDVDFVLDIRRDDNYYILYEEIWQNGEFVADGEIVAAEFNNNGRTIQAVRYIGADGESDYYTPEGRSMRKAFIRAPVDFTRISSSFNPRRKHPILNTIRAHRGVDYAAPKGTAIKAAGDGKVIFRGVKNGYGNCVILQHGGNITTLYAHMSAFAKNARMGQRVKQGQTIGFVGMTGLAQGNHLHYEYRLNGVHRNPRTVSLPQAEPIKKEYMQDFLAKAAPALGRLEQFKQTRMASVSSN